MYQLFLSKPNVFSLSNHIKVGYTDLPIGTQENTVKFKEEYSYKYLTG